MRITLLKITCLLLMTFLLVQPATSTSGKMVKASSCPTASEFHYDTDDFGWTGGSCYYNNIQEKYLVYHGSSFTQPVDLQIMVEDITPNGTSTYTYWVTVYPGQTRFYLGQDQIEWNDMDCNESQDYGEMSYHTYYLTGQYNCGS
jgi:hypothetical protein